MHAREHPSIIHAAVFVHNSIGGYALGGWKSRYSRQTESSEDTPDSRHPKKKLDAKETEGCGKYRSQTKFADLSQYVRSPLPLSLLHDEDNRAQLSGNMGKNNGTVCFH